jgi:hypothetical protein
MPQVYEAMGRNRGCAVMVSSFGQIARALLRAAVLLPAVSLRGVGGKLAMKPDNDALADCRRR